MTWGVCCTTSTIFWEQDLAPSCNQRTLIGDFRDHVHTEHHHAIGHGLEVGGCLAPSDGHHHSFFHDNTDICTRVSFCALSELQEVILGKIVRGISESVLEKSNSSLDFG